MNIVESKLPIKKLKYLYIVRFRSFAAVRIYNTNDEEMTLKWQSDCVKHYL